MGENLTLEDVIAKISDNAAGKVINHFQAENNKPEPGTKGVFRANSDGTWEKLDQNPDEWWASFSQEKPGIQHIIDVKGPNDFELITKADALDRLETYQFGKRAILSPIEDGLNSAVGRRLGNLPIGSILVGGVPGLLTSEIVDAFVPPTTSTTDPVTGVVTTTQNWLNAGIKVVAAFGVPMTVGNRLMSKTGQVIYGAVLLITAAQDFTPLDSWIANAVNWVRNLFGGTATLPNLPAGNRVVSANNPYRMLAPGRSMSGAPAISNQAQSPGNIGSPIMGAF